MQRENRKLAAIVAADIAGYSRLIGQDEEGTLRALRAHRSELIDPLIESHGGRIANTAGDSLLLEFPSAVDAVRCSVSVQDGMAERNRGFKAEAHISFRIGINVGDVIAQGDDLLGDGVNVAARLEALAQSGGICISGNVHEQVRDRLDIPFENLGEQEVKNVARPVRVWQWLPTASIIMETATDEAPLALPDKTSIAVLPFDNLSGDPEQEFFTDGMTEDIITELSRFEELFVIARNTSFTYKGQKIDVKEVAQELGVHFILEGSVRKAGNRVRITAQLINGQDGNHIWAERYDGALEDIFELQEGVTSQVVGSIAPNISRAELERVERGESVFDEAHELAWRAQALFRSGLSRGDPAMWDRAISTAIEAVEKNVKCGPAYSTICMTYSLQNLLQWGDDPSASAILAEDWAKKFFEELSGSYMAYLGLGMARWRRGQFQDAIRDLLHAHDLNPNDSTVLRFLAVVEAAAGEFEGAKKHAHLALRLSPKDGLVHPAYLALALAAFIEMDNNAFEKWAQKAIQLAPHAPIRRALMIAYAAEAGNLELLETHRQALMNTAPNFINSLFQGENQLFQKPEHMEKLLRGLRKAGFPN